MACIYPTMIKLRPDRFGGQTFFDNENFLSRITFRPNAIDKNAATLMQASDTARETARPRLAIPSVIKICTIRK